MITTNLDETSKFSFEMRIEGTKESVNDVNLVIDTKKGYSVRVPAIFSDNQIDIELPNISDIFTGDEYPFLLEVVIDSKLYIPLEDTIRFIKPLSISAKLKPKEDMGVYVSMDTPDPKVEVFSAPIVEHNELLQKPSPSSSKQQSKSLVENKVKRNFISFRNT